MDFQVTFKPIKNVFEVTDWVGGIVYACSAESSIGGIELSVLEINKKK